MNERPTPETDAFWDDVCESWSNWSVNEGHEKLLKHSHRLENERDEARSDLEFRRGLFKLQEEQLNNVREERDQYKGLLIRLHNDLFVHHGGQAVREFKELFREENYN